MKTSFYVVDKPWFSLGVDLASWALPLLVSFGERNLHVQFLCVDVDLYWEEWGWY